MFDKNDFVKGMIANRRSLDEIVEEARVEILYTESRSIRPVGGGAYVRFLRILMFFLIIEVKARPANLSDDNSRLLFRVAKYLVDRGDLESDILELFGE